MASITIRNLDDDVKRRLRIRAAEHGRSMEEEAREILRHVVGEAKPSHDLAAAIRGLSERPGALAGMGAAARQRAGEIALWPGKIERLTELYDELAGSEGRSEVAAARSA